ncbi:hypothetical protein ACF3N7_08025 [Cruoricaptor ignavus]|uniref:hypothetical protein n=1 Tax=Cruoricaptor ignavus TaxID=1118202 RepID=UPI00370D89F4
MRKIFVGFFLIFFAQNFFAQNFEGQVMMRENSVVYLNHIFVTNLRTMKTVLSDNRGVFRIAAEEGDVIRFTSMISERKDVKLTNALLQSANNLIELQSQFREIEEVVITFKPTGVLKTDVLALQTKQKDLQVAEIIGIPSPKNSSSPESLASLKDGGISFSIDAIYDWLSGDRVRKQRLKNHQEMAANIENIKKYFGVEYFTKLKIPENLTDNFLQFVYQSDNLQPYLERKNFEGIKPHIEKYLPIYQRRLADSKWRNQF